MVVGCLHPLHFTHIVLSRDFILRNYAEMKKANPHFPILIREADTAQAKLTARFGKQQNWGALFIEPILPHNTLQTMVLRSP
jgi:hypothetical protein